MNKIKAKKEFEKANDIFYNAAISNKNRVSKLKSCISIYDEIINSADITDYLLLDSKPEIPKDIYLTCMYNAGTCYKTVSDDLFEQNGNLYNEIETNYKKALIYFIKLLKIDFENANALQQMVSIYTKLCFLMQKIDLSKSLMYLQEALIFIPENATLHYNLGYIYQIMNKLELSLTHYKLGIVLNQNNNNDKESKRKLALNCYNGIGCIYRSIKQWPDALHYALKAHKIDSKDPDINNQLGVIYTEMRRTDLAEICYNKAIQHYQLAFISKDPIELLSDTYLNLGHMHSYNGNNEKAIESYNKSLEILPGNILSFQNKIMNLSYCFDSLEDKMYILDQHKLVNKLFKKGTGKYKFSKDYFATTKIKIGIVSGDFSEHPVSYFISTFLQNFDNSKFEVTCYSECIIDTNLYNENLKFKYVKNMSAENAANMIHNDKIHILLDLAGHTAFNRLDIFALKPCPIQITYIGYPYSTGLKEMDYRITDGVCDNTDVSQKFYTEKLINLPGGFLCYDPTVIKHNYKYKQPILKEQPYLKNKKEKLKIACFNRVNKITDTNIKLFDDILSKNDSVEFVFKTKGLLNKNVQKEFLSKFSKENVNRIEILPCTILHEQHVEEYNKVDIAIDTFPYSGTTTSCEALYMGVPVFTVYDSEYYFHAQNVTASLLKNSHVDLEEYIVSNKQDIHDKIKVLMEKDDNFWQNLKSDTRQKFLSGNICNKKRYITEIQKLFTDLFLEKKNN
jgi:predicted O-linked N-acetylglucosamine transferase (SPINDLY family)